MLATVADTDTGLIAPDRVVAAARLAEAAGFDGVYLGDHLLHPHPMLESIVTLSVVAAVTERISLGPCVMLFGLRHPVTLAKQLGTLAAFAPGRLRVGVGVGGEYPAEFEAAGVPLAERGRRMESVLRGVRSLLSEGIVLSGDAESGDVTIAPGAPSVPFLLSRRAELGRGDEPFPTGMLVPVHVGRSGDASAAAAAAWGKLTNAQASLPERLFAAGSPAQIAGQLHRYWEAGCTEFMLGPADQGSGYLGQVELIAAEVLPLIRGFS